MSLVNRASLAVEELISLRRDVRDANPGRSGSTRLDRASPQLQAAAAEVHPTLEFADPYWWERPILDVVEAGARSLPTWTVRADLFPSFSGFFLFARPIQVAGEREAVTAFSWVREGTGTRVVTYGAREEIYVVPYEAVQAADGTNDWKLNGEDPAAMRRRLLIFGACLLFLEQRVALASLEPVDRAAKRRLQKADIEYPALRVIRLRASERSMRSGDSAPVDWQYRWLVRGHWRQQWHPSDGSHRPLWITPYVKGPDDKPLKTPAASVFAVVR